MSQPLNATAKLKFDYVVNGLAHKLEMYVAYNDVLGQHQMVDRDGITTVLWTLGAQYVWDKFRAIFAAAALASPAQLTLLSRNGTQWNVVDITALTGIGSSGSSQTPGVQATWTVRDSQFHFIKFEALEPTASYTGKYKNGQGAGSIYNAISDMLSGADTSANAPYRFAKSRSDHFIAATGAIAGLSFRPNNKILRARGL